MYDMHIHTNNSHDCSQSIDDVCTAAIEANLEGIAICDHADMGPCDVPGSYESIQLCIEQVKEARQKYNYPILQGIEMAEACYDREKAEKILDLCNYDVVLGSVHYVEYEGISDSYARTDFSMMSHKDIYGFFSEYFDRISQMTDTDDFDVLTHLTCPIRYINGKYNKGYDVMDHRRQIKDILGKIITKNIALEINTSGFATPLMDYMPQGEIVQMYSDMGGKLVTTASDAHTPPLVGNEIQNALQLIKKCGIDHYCIYEQRKPTLKEIYR